jgi:hypothetical protein
LNPSRHLLASRVPLETVQAVKLTKFIDPHVINDRFPANPPTGAIFQFKDVTSKIGMSGFSTLIESKTSTPLGDANRINTLAGFSTAVANSQTFFN